MKNIKLVPIPKNKRKSNSESGTMSGGRSRSFDNWRTNPKVIFAVKSGIRPLKRIPMNQANQDNNEIVAGEESTRTFIQKNA
jgi:hypothetical protein